MPAWNIQAMPAMAMKMASQVRRAFDKANHDAESWLKAIMAPMETQVREHQIQLKRRLESIKRIHQATDTLEDRIDELNHVESNLVAQIHAIERAGHRIQHLLGKSLGADQSRSAAGAQNAHRRLPRGRRRIRWATEGNGIGLKPRAEPWGRTQAGRLLPVSFSYLTQSISVVSW